MNVQDAIQSRICHGTCCNYHNWSALEDLSRKAFHPLRNGGSLCKEREILHNVQNEQESSYKKSISYHLKKIYTSLLSAMMLSADLTNQKVDPSQIGILSRILLLCHTSKTYSVLKDAVFYFHPIIKINIQNGKKTRHTLVW